MTLESIVDARITLFSEVLFDYGYNPVKADASPGGFTLRAVRRAEFKEPRVAITVAETWQRGPDPEKLRPTDHGCHLLMCSWHAQITTGDVGAERLDIDPVKPAALRVHAHPFGQPNAWRVPTRFMTVERWLEIVERRLIALADPAHIPGEGTLYPTPPSGGLSRARRPRR
jgi:hypothetical protein